METAFIMALVAVVAVGGLQAVGSSIGGGDDLNEASEALGEEVVEIDAGTPDGPRAADGAGGSSGALGSAAGSVGGSGATQTATLDIDYDRSFWNTHYPGQTFNDWTVEGGSVDVKVDGRGGFDYGVGGNIIDMNGHGAGRISKTFNVLPNVGYNLSVDLGENPGGPHAKKMLAIEWNGERISTLSIDVPRNTLKTFTVKLPPSATGEGVLTFQSLLPSAYGPVIDDPTITLSPRS
ncbi:MAG: hypothetical protein AAGD35_15080 [Actinomycetota bacterium]